MLLFRYSAVALRKNKRDKNGLSPKTNYSVQEKKKKKKYINFEIKGAPKIRAIMLKGVIRELHM